MSGELSLQPFGLLFLRKKWTKSYLCIIFLSNYVFLRFPTGIHASNLSRQSRCEVAHLTICHPIGTGNGTLFSMPQAWQLSKKKKKARFLCCGLHLLSKRYQKIEEDEHWWKKQKTLHLTKRKLMLNPRILPFPLGPQLIYLLCVFYFSFSVACSEFSLKKYYSIVSLKKKKPPKI